MQARAAAMLDSIEAFVDAQGRIPKHKAKDEDERRLAKWIHNVSTGQNALSEHHRSRFDALVDRDAALETQARERLAELKVFVLTHSRLPQYDSGQTEQEQQLPISSNVFVIL